MLFWFFSFPRPSFPKQKPRLFFRDQILRDQTETFFPKPNFPKPKSRPDSPKRVLPSKNWQKSQNREVSKPKCQSLPPWWLECGIQGKQVLWWWRRIGLIEVVGCCQRLGGIQKHQRKAFQCNQFNSIKGKYGNLFQLLCCHIFVLAIYQCHTDYYGRMPCMQSYWPGWWWVWCSASFYLGWMEHMARMETKFCRCQIIKRVSWSWWTRSSARSLDLAVAISLDMMTTSQREGRTICNGVQEWANFPRRFFPLGCLSLFRSVSSAS